MHLRPVEALFLLLLGGLAPSLFSRHSMPDADGVFRSVVEQAAVLESDWGDHQHPSDRLKLKLALNEHPGIAEMANQIRTSNDPESYLSGIVVSAFLAGQGTPAP
jgi:hypothetical protein